MRYNAKKLPPQHPPGTKFQVGDQVIGGSVGRLGVVEAIDGTFIIWRDEMGKVWRTPDCHVGAMPNEEEIKKRAAALRKNWDKREREARNQHKSPPVGPPQILDYKG